MNQKNRLLIFFFLMFSVLLSSCAGRGSMVATGWAGLTVDEETVYVAFNQHVIAVNLANGTERWRFPQEPDQNISFYAPPAIAGQDSLVVGGYDNVIYRINTSNGQGQPLYDGAEGRFVGGLLVADDLIYAPSADHFLYALNLDGGLVWTFETDEPLWAKPAASPDCKCIYLSSMDHRVYALDAKTGNLLWETESLGGSIVGTPTISDDQQIYVGTFNNEIVALNAESGRVLWKFPTNDWVWSGPTLFNDSLYFGDLSGTFYAIDRQSGEIQWQLQPGAAIVGKPLIREEGIYFTTEDGNIISVNFEGTIRWTLPFEDSLQAGPMDAGDQIVVATSSPETLLIAIDPGGVQKWTYTFENR